MWTVYTTSSDTVSAGVLIIKRTSYNTLNYDKFRVSFLFDEFPLYARNVMTMVRAGLTLIGMGCRLQICRGSKVPGVRLTLTGGFLLKDK